MKKFLDKVNNLVALSAVYAADEKVAITPPPKARNLAKITVTSLIGGAITLVFIVATLIFFFMLVTGGIKWMMAGGDKEKTADARGQLTSALIGLIVIFLAWAISALLKTLFGVDILGGFDIPKFY